MARQIKKRGEERVNLFTVEQQQPTQAALEENELDQFMLANNEHMTESAEVVLSSRGNSPPKDWNDHGTMLQVMLSQRQGGFTGARTVKPFRVQPRVIFLKNKRDKVILLTDKR